MSDYQNYKKRSSKKPQQAAGETVAVEAFLVGVWNVLKWLFGKKGTGSGRSAALKALGENWGSVEMHLMQPGTQSLAVSEADKILDQALKLSGVAGNSLGERLKAAEKLFEHSLYQQIWEAHKMRNFLAHEVGATVDKQEAQWAIGIFRNALTKLGVL